MSTGFIFLTKTSRTTRIGKCIPLLAFTLVLTLFTFYLFSPSFVQAEETEPPQQIRFAAGATSGVVTATVASTGVNLYTLWARQGQQMDIVLAGNNIHLMVEAPTVQTLPDQPDTKVWSGILPQSGTYTLSVVNSSNSKEKYTLTVTIVTPAVIPPAQTNQAPILPQLPIRAQIPIAFQGTGQAIGNAVSNDVALGDLDGDGDLDAFVANGSPVLNQSNQVWLNDDKGFFAETGQDFGPGISNGVALGDLDGDGDLDALVANTGLNQIWINAWDGVSIPKFVAASNVLTGTFPFTSTAVALGDLDSDGYLDAVVANYGGVNEIWRNASKQVSGTQQLSFTPIMTDATWVADKTSDVALAYLNNDTCVDIVFVPDGVWLNTQDEQGKCTAKFSHVGNRLAKGDFASLIDDIPESQRGCIRNRDFNDKDTNTKIALSDLNNDQKVDLIIGSGDAFIYSNDGAGNLTAEAIVRHDQSNCWFGIALGDLDFDGQLDAFVTHTSSNRNNILHNEGGFIFKVIDRYAANLSQAVALGDLNADGLLDAFVMGGRNSQQSSSQVLVNIGLPLQLTLQKPAANLFNSTEAVGDKRIASDKEIDSIQLAFLDGDAYLDAITFTPNRIWLNDHYGQLTRGKQSTPGGSDIMNLATGDLNNDRAVDFITSRREYLYDEQRNRHSNTKVEVFINDGNSFTRSLIFTSSLDVHSDTTVLGDLNNDGYLDMILARWCGKRQCSDYNQIYLNDQTGKLNPAGKLGGGATMDVALGDLDDDNDLDAVVANYWNQPTTIYFNDGKGAFSEEGIELGSFSSVEVAVADLDNDGALDIVESHYEMGITVWWNEGQKRFVEEGLLWEPAERHDIEVADMNGDGWLDVVVSASLKSHNILLNTSARRFNRLPIIDDQHHTPLPSNALGDLDNDGDIDALFAYADGIAQYVNQREGIINPAVVVATVPLLKLSATVTHNQPITETIIPIQLSPCPFLACKGRDVSEYIRAEYSFTGGGQWFPAKPPISSTVRAKQPNVFFWDTFASGFFGQSNNVVLRLMVQAQPVQIAPVGTYTYPNQIAGSYQAATGVATTEPFAVRGTLVRVCKENAAVHKLQPEAACRQADDAITDSLPVTPVANAVVYAWRAGNPTAQRMGDTTTGSAFVTDVSGYLSGRGQLAKGDQLLAMLPVTHTYRIPPQLLFDGSGGYVQVNPTTPVTGARTIEFWLFPVSKSGTLLTVGKALTLTYASVTKTATISLALPGYLLTTTQVTVNDGLAHHLAVSWQTGENGVISLYADGQDKLDSRLPISTALGSVIRLGEQYTGAMDEIRLWNVARTASQISATLGITSPLYNTANADLFTVEPTARSSLLGYWPIDQEDGPSLQDQSGHDNDAKLVGGVYVGYKPLATIYHTSGAISDTVRFSTVITPGVQPLVVSSRNPLILFDLDVSLEWDARNDMLFLQQLEDSFKRASALLYDVTNGQMALGQINLFHNKAYWGVADIIIFADNSLRPSAAIGGVVKGPIDDPKEGLAGGKGAYLPGQVRMGISWDPYGENIADLGDAWARALAHELAHYLLFLPDNYLGLDDRGIMRRVVCPGSFMTSSSDPNYSEFLTTDAWNPNPDKLDDPCEQTLAHHTTKRADWDTIKAFYPMLIAPDFKKLEGPPDLPLEVTALVPWAFADQTPPLPARNFDIRNPKEERLRLPDAQAYLIKAQGTTMPAEPGDLSHLEDDVLVALGSPTGGGDRLKVRGAAAGDRLCVFDNRNRQSYSGCIDSIKDTTVAVTAKPIHQNNWLWKPTITVHAETAYSVAVTVEQTLRPNETLMAQLFPMHYGSVAGNAPVQCMNCRGITDTQASPIYTHTLTLTLPAYEIAVRVWVEDDGSCARGTESTQENSCIREAISTFRLNPDHWDPVTNSEDSTETIPLGQLIYAPLAAGPDKSGIGGPDKSGIGGPNRIIIGGAVLIGNPDKSGIGGPDKSGIGGALRMLLGNPNSIATGGMSMIGNPDRSGIGGAAKTPGGSGDGGRGPGLPVFNAPILSADAQVVIYNRAGFFADNGVKSLQALAVTPALDSHPWLLPVGLAYRVVLSDTQAERFISFNYLQRDVPEGYEQTLKIYFLPEGGTTWVSVTENVGFVENLIVGRLNTTDGVYAVMATVELPELQPGWNLLAYPMPDRRCVRQATPGTLCIDEKGITDISRVSEKEQEKQCADGALASLGSHFDKVRVFTAEILSVSKDNIRFSTDGSEADMFKPGHTYWIHVIGGQNVTPFFAPPKRQPDGTLPCSDPVP